MDFQKQLAAALDAAGVPVDGSEEAAAADASVDDTGVCVRVLRACISARCGWRRTLDLVCRLWTHAPCVGCRWTLGADGGVDGAVAVITLSPFPCAIMIPCAVESTVA